MGMKKLNSITVIPHTEYTIDEEVEFTTSTQYVISFSGSNEKGVVQVREMLVSVTLTDGDPTAGSRPAKINTDSLENAATNGLILHIS